MTIAATRRDCLSMAAGLGLTSRAGAAVSAPSTRLISLEGIAPGQQVEVPWNGDPVFIRRRTPAEIDRVRAVPLAELNDPQRDEDRVIDEEWIVVIGKCTHAGCRPLDRLSRFDGWLCLCHGSDFDVSGRVRRGPAPANLAIPPYRFVSPQMIEIGVLPRNKAGVDMQ